MFSAAVRSSARRAATNVTRPTATRSALRNAGGARRAYSATEPTGQKTSYTLPLGIAVVGLAGGAFYFFNSEDGLKKVETLGKEAKQSVKSATGFVPTKADYQKVYNAIADLMESEESSNYEDGSYGPILLRLGWHSSGTYDVTTGTGGSNFATMRFEPESLHGANNGLHIARNLMEKIKQKFPWISYGDLWTLGGVAAIQEMGGPIVPWRPGRIDGYAKDATPDGRLPDAKQGADHLRQIFYRMGFNDQEIVALSGGHAVGRCHPDRSGFEGPWTFSPISVTNQFYKLLLEEKWVWKKWNGPKQLVDKKTGTLMMLPTDYALTQDKVFKKWTQAYADDQDLFFRDFSKVVARLFELGVPATQWVTSEPWHMKTLDEQKA
jgi:cytochrome c peroxidase